MTCLLKMKKKKAKRSMACPGCPPPSLFFYSKLFSILFLPHLRKTGCLLSQVSFSSPVWFFWLWERSLFPLLFPFLLLQYSISSAPPTLSTHSKNSLTKGPWSFLLNRLSFSHQWSIMGRFLHPHSTWTLSWSGFSSPHSSACLWSLLLACMLYLYLEDGVYSGTQYI